MMRIFGFCFLTVLGLLVVMPTAARAGDVYACGVPKPAELDLETEGVCDFYTRQIAYRTEANEMRRLLLERQKSFQAPAKKSLDQYKENIKKLNEERGTPKKEDQE